MKFVVIKRNINPIRDHLANKIVKACQAAGHKLTTSENHAKFVFNLTNVELPLVFRRRSHTIFVLSMVFIEQPIKDIHEVCQRMLAQTLSNMVLCIVPAQGPNLNGPYGKYDIYFTSSEGVFYHYPFEAKKVCDSIVDFVADNLVK
jgi:hypothetical protein